MFVVETVCWNAVAGIHNDDVLELDLPAKLFEQGQHHFVDQQDAIFGVLDDESQILGMQPQVEGMQNEPARRCAKIGFEMSLVIPTERSDPVPGLHAQLGQGDCEPAGSADDVAIGDAFGRSIR